VKSSGVGVVAVLIPVVDPLEDVARHVECCVGEMGGQAPRSRTNGEPVPRRPSGNRGTGTPFEDERGASPPTGIIPSVTSGSIVVVW
jgi:hypothetical protein